MDSSLRVLHLVQERIGEKESRDGDKYLGRERPPTPDETERR
jgi:hypothetical protein